MSQINIARVLALPEIPVVNTLYFVSIPGNKMELHFCGESGATKHISTEEEVLNQVTVRSPTPPALPCKSPLWWNTAEGTLYVQYNDGNSDYWVEAISSIVVPDFAGTGTANTMARSDHNHDETYVKVGANQW